MGVDIRQNPNSSLLREQVTNIGNEKSQLSQDNTIITAKRFPIP